MSHKLAKNNNKYHNKPSKSASKQSQAQSWIVGDSCLHLSHCITNATGTFSRFIKCFFKVSEIQFSLAFRMALMLIPVTGLVGLFDYPNIYASTYSASITAPSSIELNVSPSGNGANVTSSDLVVNSTCPLGYTVSIAGPSDSTLYLNGDTANVNADSGNNSNTDTSNGTSNVINASSGTKASPASIIGSSNLNTWGYSVNSNTTATTSTFIGLTNTTTELLSTNTASASGGDTIPVYYGASAAPTLAMGAYTFVSSNSNGNSNGSGSSTSSDAGKITYYLTTSPDCMSYNVQFNPTSTAGGTTLTGTGTMDDQRIPEDVVTILNRNTFTPPTGYYFTGWNTKQDGTGTTYLDRQQVKDIADVGTTTPLTLYAQYKPIINCNPSGTTIADTLDLTNDNTTNSTDIKCMQDITATNKASILASMTEDQQYQLIDKRDQKIYWVSKLKDGHIWMTQNLDLDLFTDRPLTSEDTDLIDHSLTGAYQAGYTYDSNTGITTWTPANDTISAITDAGTPGSVSGWANSYLILSADSGNWYYTDEWNLSSECGDGSVAQWGYCDYIYKSNSDYALHFSTSPYANGPHGHVGNYYNWSAAIASNDSSHIVSSTLDNPSDSPQNSVCPVGWRLPIVTSYASGSLGTNEFYNLSYYYNDGSTKTSIGLAGSPTYFIRAGRMISSGLIYAGYGGYVWSNVPSSDAVAYNLYITSGTCDPTSRAGQRWNGRSVRCLVR